MNSTLQLTWMRFPQRDRVAALLLDDEAVFEVVAASLLSAVTSDLSAESFPKPMKPCWVTLFPDPVVSLLVPLVEWPPANLANLANLKKGLEKEAEKKQIMRGKETMYSDLEIRYTDLGSLIENSQCGNFKIFLLLI